MQKDRLRVLRNCVERSADLATYKGLRTNLWAPCGYVRPERYTRKILRTMSPVSEMALFAAEGALEQAGLRPDYMEAVDSDTLKPVKTVAKGVTVLLAAYAGKTRLIDNAEFSPEG